MGEWTHSICKACWDRKEPTVRLRLLRLGTPDTCCFCGQGTTAGLYVRHDPAALRCKGQHRAPTQGGE